MTIKNNSITPELEQKLTISNLVFLAISKLTIRQLEIMKKVKSYERINPKILIREVEKRLGFQKKQTINEIEELAELRIIIPRTKEKNKELELTELGKLITTEVEREV